MKAMPNSSSRVQRSFCAISDAAFKDIEQSQVFTQMGLSGTMGWEDVLQSPRVLIISEAGSGKTYECQAEKDRLWAEGQAAFFIELAELSRGDLRSLLSPEEEVRFDEWQRSQSGTATFFLDSYDELKLTQGSFSVALNRLAKALSGHLGRARIVLTSRPVPFDEAMFKQKLPVPSSTPVVEISKERAFAEVATGQKRRQAQEVSKEMPPDWCRVYLMPLSPEQIRALIVAEEVSDPDALLAAIYQRNAQEFTQRPLDLIELCVDWRDCQQIRA
ncbi:MAG: hypothetical protein LWW81_14485, partial [Rhodocyclales bacterium]|nr:hypothetical protein [Rhodocyclales bacterium]